jgi:hypothetical protein
MGHDKNRTRTLEATRERLASWRQLHGGRGRPIPAALWSDAAEVARGHGVPETARTLRLDPRKLAKRVEEGVAIVPRGTSEIEQSTAFVELGGLALGGLALREPRAKATVVELVGREGDRVRVEVVGDAGSAVDLVALARAFWGRST